VDGSRWYRTQNAAESKIILADGSVGRGAGNRVAQGQEKMEKCEMCEICKRRGLRFLEIYGGAAWG
jgi:hypothetical protein